MKVNKVFILITLINVYMLLTFHLHLEGLPFLVFNVLLSFPCYIFLPGYCIIKIVFSNYSLRLYEVVIFSFSLGVLMFSLVGLLCFIFHCLPLVKYFVIILSYILYIFMWLRVSTFNGGRS